MSAHDRTIRGMIQDPRGPSQVSRPKADSHRDLDAVGRLSVGLGCHVVVMELDNARR